MNVLQAIIGEPIPAHSPNILIVEDCVGSVLITISGSGLPSFSIRRYPIDGVLKLDMSGITKHISATRDEGYSDSFDYSADSNDSLFFAAMVLEDDIDSVGPIQMNMVNGALQLQDEPYSIGQQLHFYDCATTEEVESSISQPFADTLDFPAGNIGIVFSPPVSTRLKNMTIGVNGQAGVDSTLDIEIFEGNGYTGASLYTGTQLVLDSTELDHDLTSDLNLTGGDIYTIRISQGTASFLRWSIRVGPIPTGYVQWYKDGASYSWNINNTLTFSNTIPIEGTKALKVFEGYPIDYSALQSNRIDRILVSNGITLEDVDCDIDLVQDCGGVYIKWLNTLGGYDYWLFEKEYSEEVSTKSIGEISYNFDNWTTAESRVHDLGRDVERTKKLSTKVDKAYQRHIEGLLMSPEVYLYTAEQGSGDIEWLKVRPKNGSYQTLRNKFNTIEFSVDILLPEIYTQRL